MKVLFLGDSITQGFDLQKHFPGNQFVNHGLSGLSSLELLESMSIKWFEFNPDAVFLCVGTNDLARDYHEKETLLSTRELLRRVRELSKETCLIFLISVFPTRHNLPRPNDLINQLNHKLHGLALESGVTFLHLNPFFCDPNGQLKLDFTADGLHLTDSAYGQWKGLINMLLKEIPQS